MDPTRLSTSSVTPQLRPAHANDARALHALMAGIYAEDRWFVGDAAPEAAVLARRIRSLDARREAWLLADLDVGAGVEPVGWLEVRRLAFQRVEHVATLTLGVARHARRRGVGRALLQGAERWARRVGVEKLRLDVRAGNHAAVALYLREGFEREGVERGLIRDASGYEDNLLFGKFLLVP